MNLQDAPKDNPHELFTNWLTTAQLEDPDYYNGMNLSTVNQQGTPTSRVVLLKEHDEKGFVFYTNYHSCKGQEIAQNPNVAATFWWSKTQRQIRIEGSVEKVSAEQSDNYFYQRPRGSQLAAIASVQSAPVDSFQQLENNYAKVAAEYDNQPIQRPEHWGGYRIKPQRIEFWQGLAHRLHHRLVYQRSDNLWITEVLQP